MRLAFVAAWLAASLARGATVELVDDAVVPGRWANVAVEGLDPGDAVLASDVASTHWPHGGGRVVVPVLVPPDVGERWRVLLNGEPLEVAMDDVATAREALPPLSPVMPVVYESLPPWPEGPDRGVRLVTGLVVVAAGATAVFLRRTGSRLAAVGGGLIVLGLIWWRQDDVAVRQATLAGDGFVDEWTVWKADARRPRIRAVPVEGLTLPVGFSAGHLRRMYPTLTCDARGTPVGFSVIVDSTGTAAIVRRVPGTTQAEPPAWATALRRLYP